MKIKKFTFLILLFLTSASAQVEFDFSGYAVAMPAYQSMGNELASTFNIDKNISTGISRLRIRPVLYLWDGARINLEHETNAIYLSSSLPFFSSFNINTNRQAVDLSWDLIIEEKFQLRHFIDRLYFRQSFEFGNIIIGRQRIAWGTGRVWNPTDLFNPINPANFSKIEKDGADAVSAKFNLGDFTDLHLVFNPREKIGSSNYGFRFRTNFNEYDVSAMGGVFDDRLVAGLDFAGNFFDAGLRGEGIVSMDKDKTSENFVKFILGIDYQFTPDLYCLAEYHFNGEGKTEKSEYEFDRLGRGEIINLNKNYFHISASYQYNPLLKFTISNNLNLNDKSGYVGLLGNYSVTEDFYITVGSQIIFGEELSEYWYYPQSFYLQAEYYF